MVDPLLAKLARIDIKAAASKPSDTVKAAIKDSVAFVQSLPPSSMSNAWENKFPDDDMIALLAVLEGLVKGGNVLQGSIEINSQLQNWRMFISSLFVFLRRLREAPVVESNRLSKIVLAGSIAKHTAVSSSSADLDIVLIFEAFQATEEENKKLVEWTERALESGEDIGLELSRRFFRS